MNVMTGGGITHEETAKSIGMMSEGGRKQSLQVESCAKDNKVTIPDLYARPIDIERKGCESSIHDRDID